MNLAAAEPVDEDLQEDEQSSLYCILNWNESETNATRVVYRVPIVVPSVQNTPPIAGHQTKQHWRTNYVTNHDTLVLRLEIHALSTTPESCSYELVRWPHHHLLILLF